jgi:hypothetical protein
MRFAEHRTGTRRKGFIAEMKGPHGIPTQTRSNFGIREVAEMHRKVHKKRRRARGRVHVLARELSKTILAPPRFINDAFHYYAKGFRQSCGRIVGTFCSSFLFIAAALVLIAAFEGFMWGCRETCFYKVEDSHEDWLKICLFRTYWLTIVITILTVWAFMVAFRRLYPELLKDCSTRQFLRNVFVFYMCLPFFLSAFVGGAVFLPQTVIGYPGIVMADLSHWSIMDLKLSEVAGTNANGIYLTGDESVRVALEYAKSADGKCQREEEFAGCSKYSQVCVAPMVYTEEYAASGREYIKSMDEASSSASHVSPKAWNIEIPEESDVQAWAVCVWNGHCVKKNAEGLSVWDEQFLKGECFQSWNSSLYSPQTTTSAQRAQGASTYTHWPFHGGSEGRESYVGKMHVVSYFEAGMDEQVEYYVQYTLYTVLAIHCTHHTLQSPWMWTSSMRVGTTRQSARSSVMDLWGPKQR